MQDDYGHKFCLAMQTIRKKFKYNTVHANNLIKFILLELTGVKGVRITEDAQSLNDIG